ncbi:hypothetical protein [Polaromonas eurypsychrophila]|uniref:hypothetical protein n=1 Tax=Polaromonas eurypsychrophila TaxID=1614635 RepID=UPI0016631285|nr:hypothetical protein [Polaromonas eurypsychrophila]
MNADGIRSVNKAKIGNKAPAMRLAGLDNHSDSALQNNTRREGARDACLGGFWGQTR